MQIILANDVQLIPQASKQATIPFHCRIVMVWCHTVRIIDGKIELHRPIFIGIHFKVADTLNV